MSRDAIASLVHRYADAVVRRDGEQWAACWAEDARWVLGAGLAVDGRDAVVSLWTAAMRGFDTVVQMVHNGDVHLDGATGEGRWYVSEHYRRADGEVGLLLGAYDDTYVHAEGGWRFRSRTLETRYHGPPDLSGTFPSP